MDDFRTIVKTFEQLGDDAERERSYAACLNLTRTVIDAQLQRKIREFLEDHLVPAKFENAGKVLGRRQGVLHDSLEQVLQKASRYEQANGPATILVPGRASQGEARWAEPAAASDFFATPASLGVSTVLGGYSGNNIFHSYQTPNMPTSGYPTPTSDQGPSQLEQMYAYGGAGAIAQDNVDDMVCQDLGERYGGVWSAPKWAGKGAPEMYKQYGDKQ